MGVSVPLMATAPNAPPAASAGSTAYEVHDTSVLIKPYKRFVWGPMLHVLPDGASANTLTVVGTVLCQTALWSAILLPHDRFTCALIAALSFAYMCLDNLDGAQARRTGTSSPLGEFLDHWLDSFNSTAQFLTGAVTWHVLDLRGAAMVALAGVAFNATFWEQRVTGRVHFAWLGNVEGLTLATLLYAAGAVFGHDAMLRTPIAAGQPLPVLFVWLSIATCLVTAFGAVVRVRREWREFAILSAPFLALIAWVAWGDPPVLAAALIVLPLTAASGGRAIVGRVTRRPEVGPARWLLALVLVAVLACLAVRPPASTQAVVAWALVCVALAETVFDFARAMRALSPYVRDGELLAWVVPRG